MIDLELPALEIRGISKRFPRSTTGFSVRDLNLIIKRGEIVGLLGPNGAGKTTTIRMIISVLKPDTGTIHIFGRSLSEQRSEALQEVAFASTYTNLPLFLTVTENLDIHARMYGLQGKEKRARIEEVLAQFRAVAHRNKRVGQLSAGERTRIMLARAFLPRPSLAVLDEPTASLDPDIAQEVRDIVAAQRKELGTTILFSSHNMTEVTELCDRVIFLRDGRVIATDTPAQLAATVGGSIVELEIPSDRIHGACELLGRSPWAWTNKEQRFSIEIKEGQEAELFSYLAARHVGYARVSIHRPTLEDYFLLHAKGASPIA
jgi:ABC-2 type transport system ATP-binding protein